MAEEETNSRIEELKARLEADPGSRVFYQLGEELRKADRLEEAESVLREGLEKHPAYLSAWISLGRVLKTESKPEEAIDVLNRAFNLDQQNVVAARLLGEAYAEIGENVEAIKKYKLVAALHPADEAIQEQIEELERKLEAEGKLEKAEERSGRDPAPTHAPEPPAETAGQGKGEETEEPPEPEPKEQAQEPVDEEPIEAELPGGDPHVEEAAPPPFVGREDQAEPEEAPLEEDEAPTPADEGVVPDQSLEDSPVVGLGNEAEGATEMESEAQPDPASPELARNGEEAEQDVVATVTMGDLYARQGHVEQAREIYRKVLDANPENPEAIERLESLEEEKSQERHDEGEAITPQQRKIRRLEEWLSKVNRD